MTFTLLNEVESEVTALLSDLIRINTTNPPGNETKAAKYLAETLEKDGLECTVLESAPGRGNIVSRIRGTCGKPSLLLLSHLDVVAANPKEWSVDPFSGLVKDGFVWGRGALDMKSMIAMEVMVMKLLKRNNVTLKGDLVFAATADEEKGGEAGAGWLVRHHLEKVKADYVINEGGGQAIPMNGKSVFTVQTAEKGILWLKIKARGTPGHGSMLGTADNAILRMNRVIEKLGNYHAEIMLVPTVKQFLTTVAEENALASQFLTLLIQNPDLGDQILDAYAEKDRAMAEEIRAMVKMTLAPTMIYGGVKENIIPSECEAVFDCRILPGKNTADTLKLVKELLKDDLENLEFHIIQANEPSESPINMPLYQLMVKVLKEYDSNCSVTPTLSTGGTDSRFFRRMGIPCYGFHPALSDIPYRETLKMLHGVDERISTRNLVFGTSILYDVVERFLT